MTFEKSELGRVLRFLPIREMAGNSGLAGKSMRPKPEMTFCFVPEGKVALMSLKMYAGQTCPRTNSFVMLEANLVYWKVSLG